MRATNRLISVLAASLLASSCFWFLGQIQASAKKDEGVPVVFEVAGTVTDEQKAPVKGAMVFLIDKQENSSLAARTDHHGKFSLSHGPSGHLILHVVPPLKSELAQATLSDIPGDEGRHVLISVRKGFHLQGRVVFNHDPLKDVIVRVRPSDDDTVHGGGETKTNGKGEFQLVLTPGHKMIELSNITDSRSVGAFREKYNVVGDGKIPDIAVPPVKAAGAK